MPYLVLFENNVATDAVWTESSRKVNDYVDFDTTSAGIAVKSFYVDADEKEQAMQIANNVVRQVWGKMFG